ncbi:MAG TPA: metal ABC transporter permease [Thermomicrobiales bacterium]|nr:metal ABC transporter permease [Thermomicrobiales bacterium]
MLEFLTEPWSYPFMQRAFIEVVIIGIATGLVGCLVVLRGLAFIGDALIHAVFPGVVLAMILGYDIMLGAFIFGGATALGIGLASRNQRVSHDAAIGVVFTAFFALGIVMVSARRGFAGEVTALLFGNILAISERDILITAALAAGVILTTLAFMRVFVLIAFDRTLAASAGYPVFRLELLLLLLVTVTVVFSLQAIGNLLVLSLLVTPAAAARVLTDRLTRMLVFSVLIAVGSGITGLYVSFHYDLSASGSIALTTTSVFLLALVFAPRHGYVSRYLQFRRGEHHAHHFHEVHEESQVEGTGNR